MLIGKEKGEISGMAGPVPFQEAHTQDHARINWGTYGHRILHKMALESLQGMPDADIGKLHYRDSQGVHFTVLHMVHQGAGGHGDRTCTGEYAPVRLPAGRMYHTSDSTVRCRGTAKCICRDKNDEQDATYPVYKSHGKQVERKGRHSLGRYHEQA